MFGILALLASGVGTVVSNYQRDSESYEYRCNAIKNNQKYYTDSKGVYRSTKDNHMAAFYTDNDGDLIEYNLGKHGEQRVRVANQSEKNRARDRAIYLKSHPITQSDKKPLIANNRFKWISGPKTYDVMEESIWIDTTNNHKCMMSTTYNILGEFYACLISLHIHHNCNFPLFIDIKSKKILELADTEWEKCKHDILKDDSYFSDDLQKDLNLIYDALKKYTEIHNTK